MQNHSLPRREREKLAQREEMLATALALFSEKGYGNVSMHEIAQKAEFAIGTLYKFFKSKEDLYRALVREESSEFHAQLMKAIKEPEKEIDKLRNFVKVKGEFFQAHAAMIRVYFSETQGVRFNIMAGADSEVRKQYDQVLDALREVFQSGIKGRRFKRIADPYYLAVALQNITNAFLFLWLEDSENHPYPDAPDTILNILFKGLL